MRTRSESHRCTSYQATRGSLSVEFSLQADDTGPIIAGDPAEVDRAFDRILAAAPRLLHNPTAFIRERPRTGPAGVPDHGLKLDVCPAHGVGAMSYYGDPDTSGQPGPWITRGPGPSPVVLRRDIDSATPYPADAAVTLDDIRRALHEFLTTGGRRPTAVDWQQATTW
ncbi:Imm1 family immunity protein [Solwaraspora sp. WMMD1047]|uniref:Imm1 family immunity protein n=1 Tax=Solwaraspora sp. WMMD1047 TaxID=3016102 RepID=UPI002416ED8E|nr:Imm1 family immunity protein [Solwaraspora sp. WMMD1047]MDG4834093.1 Imm1 family immunity protein [Solwaraspora sp. WMMD1047]